MKTTSGNRIHTFFPAIAKKYIFFFFSRSESDQEASPEKGKKAAAAATEEKGEKSKTKEAADKVPDENVDTSIVEEDSITEEVCKM